MNSTVATESPERTAVRPLLETWGKNERMRHVPPMGWLIEKVDVDLRRRIEKLGHAASHESIEGELRMLCRAIDRLADAAKFSRTTANFGANDIRARLNASINNAVSSLSTLDANLFGRRYPFQTFERSKAELLYGALLVVIERVHRLTTLVRSVDADIDERLLEGLVVLREPLREQAIA